MRYTFSLGTNIPLLNILHFRNESDMFKNLMIIENRLHGIGIFAYGTCLGTT